MRTFGSLVARAARPCFQFKNKKTRAGRPCHNGSTASLAIIVLLLCSYTLRAECTLTESKRKFEGGERTVVHMENERIIVEIVPELEGRVIKYVDKSRSSPTCGFEWLDDCPYHYGGRWEGVPFEYHIDAKGPDHAAVTVSGGGKIAVALLHHLTGADVANPLDLKVQRTMTIESGSTRLRIDVKITNAGEGVAPQFRYMVHAVFGDVPPMPIGRALWFLPTSKTVELFDEKRGAHDMGQAAGGAPLDSPFSRFTPGFKADKPRYEAGGWGALLTSGGPVYLYYDPKQFDFQQFWFGGDSEWHYTFEPHTKPVELKPGESTTTSYTLSYDSKDVPFIGPTVAYEPPVVPEDVMPGGTLTVKTRATTVRDQNEHASVKFDAADSRGQTLVSKTIDGDVQPFHLTDLSADFKLPDTVALGKYKWKAVAGDGRELASGTFEIVSAEEQARRQTETATAGLKAELTLLKQQLQKNQTESRRLEDLWKQGADLALSWNDERFWSGNGAAATASVAVSLDPVGVPVQGQWKKKESIRIKSLTAPKSPPLPADPDKILALLGADRPFVRDVAVDGDGKGLVVLIVDAAKKRVEIVRLRASGIVRRFGHFSDQPGETDPTLGIGARAIAVDASGNIWVTTNAWGKTSVLVINQDGAPSEEAVIAAKGALKKFSPSGAPLGSIGLLSAPTDLALANADGAAVVLCSYRQVSTYHGTQVREGLLVVGIADCKRLSEIKVPAGSVAVDSTGRIWTADVAGHVACADVHGHKLFDVKNSPPPAVLDAVLPASSPLPAVVRPAATGGVWVLSTLKRSLATVSADEAAAGSEVPASAGEIYRMTSDGDGIVIVGEKVLWKQARK